MSRRMPSTASCPALLAGGVIGLFRAGLLVLIGLAPTLFGSLHRFGSFDLLLAVWFLLALGVVVAIVGLPLRSPRSWSNLCLWAMLILVLFQVLPLPLVDGVGRTPAGLGPAAAALTDPGLDGGAHGHGTLPVGRYSLRASATVGVLVAIGSAAGLYWLIGAAVSGRRRLWLTTGAAIGGMAMLAYLGIIADSGSAAQSVSGPARLVGPVTVLGGDSLVPALLAVLPLCLAAVLRTLGWMPHREHRRRALPWGWMTRGTFIWPVIGLVVTAMVAVALGMSNAPRRLLAVCAILSICLVLGGYVWAGPVLRQRRRVVLTALALAAWVLGAVWLGSEIGRRHQPAASADAAVESLLAALPAERAAFGAGAGSISPRLTFGLPGWPAGPGDDCDTDGYLVIRAELGWAGLGLCLAAAATWALFMIRVWRRSQGPWPKMAAAAGLGALAANLLYLRTDAAALLVPNLLALACVFGVVAAWAGQGGTWRPGRRWNTGRFRGPLFVGAIGTLAALGLAESEMLSSSEMAPEISDKFMHFATFAVLTLVLASALDRVGALRRLGASTFLAILATASLGVALEYAQRYLTYGRFFELGDMAASVSGSVLMGAVWWLMSRTDAPAEAAAPPPA